MSRPQSRPSLLEPNDPMLRSWVPGANNPDGDFPIQNLPYGIVDGAAAVRIGDSLLVLQDALHAGLFSDELLAWDSFEEGLELPFLNLIAELPHDLRRRLRSELAGFFVEGSSVRARVEPLLRDATRAAPEIPFSIGDYTDFYASLHHATNVGSMFRPTNPLLPNWKHVPIGYHGRASSVVASGTGVVRPCGQTVSNDDGPPSFGPSRLLDYELEVGFFVGHGNELGSRIDIA
ncbi:MAG: fumarylacetoacetate hydrolase family protein, partial [Planctomycetota bacterium]|nr:fumarylacetoacetate hydrolase family protein [Planctomycetota bacterium]